MGNDQMSHQWVQLWGAQETGRETFIISNETITFKGYDSNTIPPDKQYVTNIEPSLSPAAAEEGLPSSIVSGHGLLLSNRRFTEGNLSVDIEFLSIQQQGPIAAEIV